MWISFTDSGKQCKRVQIARHYQSELFLHCLQMPFLQDEGNSGNISNKELTSRSHKYEK